jgi:cob(I)alamin adenosyltransferase
MAERHSLVIINTGNGKGKSTAAFGLVLRAWGRGWKIAVLQYLKSATNNYGERRAARKLGIEWLPMGDGWTWTSTDLDRTSEMARDCWERSKAMLSSGDYDLIVLDELTYAVKYGWLSAEEVIEGLRARSERTFAVITGRDAPPDLIDFADLVTEMREIKHPFHKGVRAQPGIEF